MAMIISYYSVHLIKIPDTVSTLEEFQRWHDRKTMFHWSKDCKIRSWGDEYEFKTRARAKQRMDKLVATGEYDHVLVLGHSTTGGAGPYDHWQSDKYKKFLDIEIQEVLARQGIKV